MGLEPEASSAKDHSVRKTPRLTPVSGRRGMLNIATSRWVLGLTSVEVDALFGNGGRIYVGCFRKEGRMERSRRNSRRSRVSDFRFLVRTPRPSQLIIPSLRKRRIVPELKE